jgi:VWFA-related protein
VVVRAGAWILLSCLAGALCEQPEDAHITARSDPATSAPADADRTFSKIRVNSDLVIIPVTVTDGKGRVVNGLQKEHFKLYEDKVEHEIAQFSAEDAPVSIGLVFDASDSMGPKLQKAREAVAALLKNSNPEDEFFMVQFNQRPKLVVSMTRQSEEIKNRVASVRTGGSTALLDAVILALEQMRNAHYTRKAIIIISDGEDNASSYSVKQLKDNVHEADVLIYAIGINDSGDTYQTSKTLTGAALLNEIAQQTGGRLFEVNKLKQLPDIASKISAWLRSQYVLAYAPNNSEKNGGYHRIRVKITKPAGFPRLHAFWRLGYYSPSE